MKLEIDKYLWEGGVKAMMDDYNSYQPFEQLKVNCYPCNIEAYASHSRVYDKFDTWRVNMWCSKCGKREAKEFTTDQIKKSNESGTWQAFMDRL